MVSRHVSARMTARPERGSGALFWELHVLLGAALGQALQPAMGLQHRVGESEQQLLVGR